MSKKGTIVYFQLLMDAMYETGWIDTISSSKSSPHMFITYTINFHCKLNKILELCQIINKASEKFDSDMDSKIISLLLEVDFRSVVIISQFDDKRDRVPLQLTIACDKDADTNMSSAVLTELFKARTSRI